MHARDWLLVFVGFFFPPIPVIVKKGFCSADLLINILLCILGFFPGLLHAYYIIAMNPHQENYIAIGSGEQRVGDYGAISS
ncbi:uncharacterized protein SPAPADRAFT_61122 [Spathaspora passalidarum NRRL Y-27907]|uniref:Plasma membrane proteolipid 3 n=1 Tax=Spathaspora passalidarum (strain NRRL Y-27907 / 11-Y1) TaxID=619300 RepID=G3ANT5_SPAPN|nr:uncharacterized protein SPAPADRAFT_61122 [Spathaspora passalidarum NRRL Y-27907]EGW32020.1 hypothetical protein SPAPADRAFT_61122 [Spathaspora passalidarum NRRL Y-27907]